MGAKKLPETRQDIASYTQSMIPKKQGITQKELIPFMFQVIGKR
jgi:hypothetical protein